MTLSWTHGGASHDLAGYLNQHPATGLLIARGGTILFEQYQYARTDQDRFMSQSMARTITAMLAGIAVAEGAIGSFDQPAADYVPALAGTEYGKTPIRALPRMASGVAFHEVYDGTGECPPQPHVVRPRQPWAGPDTCGVMATRLPWAGMPPPRLWRLCPPEP